MNPSAPDLPDPLRPDDLRRLARPAAPRGPCAGCAALVCPGWESLPGSFDTAQLQRLASLRVAADEEPSLREYHPAGSHGWSADAPIAPGWFPYNRCEVWGCRGCGRAFLRYTEYGGYYVDERIRELRAELVVDVAPPD
ncbi:MAG: hypothetical protein KGL43_02370 [Burkholderiales bacterium]|nr:hypothetical protein [Burkholderiales bacterium]MDE2452414.1 hypothetical protein [Burkholderiales bacterium]